MVTTTTALHHTHCTHPPPPARSCVTVETTSLCWDPVSPTWSITLVTTTTALHHTHCTHSPLPHPPRSLAPVLPWKQRLSAGARYLQHGPRDSKQHEGDDPDRHRGNGERHARRRPGAGEARGADGAEEGGAQGEGEDDRHRGVDQHDVAELGERLDGRLGERDRRDDRRHGAAHDRHADVADGERRAALAQARVRLKYNMARDVRNTHNSMT